MPHSHHPGDLLPGEGTHSVFRYLGRMLYRRRERLRLLAEQEAAGSSLWTEDFSPEARMKIQFAFEDNVGADPTRVAQVARGLILRDEGIPYLADRRLKEYADLLAYLSKCNSEMVPTVIEAMYIAIVNGKYVPLGARELFEGTVRTALREHRIKFDLIEGVVVPLESLVMHVDVVEPTLILLGNDGRFHDADQAFRAALGEIADGHPSDAITDAGTSLQEVLTKLGCSGNALGPLIKSAKSNGLLAPHDGPMLDAIERVAHWVSADRSERGDAHKVASATIEDAWFIVHVVGAIILRLGRGAPRNG